LDVIAQYGTDSLRLALLIGNTPGNNSRLSMEKVEAQRNFVNKLWNISRFIIGNEEFPPKADQPLSESIEENKLTGADAWILKQCQDLIAGVRNDIDSFAFSAAGEKLINFIWNDLADWYLEASKFEAGENKKDILPYVLRTILKLAHPFMPFVSEAIWKKFNDSLLLVEKYPEADAKLAGFDQQGFAATKEIVMAIRNARAENKVEPARKIEAIIYAGRNIEAVKQNEILIKSLKTGISDLKISAKGEKISGAIYAAVGEIEIYLLGAVDTEKEKVRLEKEIANLEKFAAALNGKLANREFIDRAPEKVVTIEKEKLAKAEIELAKLKDQLKNL
jgi:valyl-tRNA synthetase